MIPARAISYPRSSAHTRQKNETPLAPPSPLSNGGPVRNNGCPACRQFRQRPLMRSMLSILSIRSIPYVLFVLFKRPAGRCRQRLLLPRPACPPRPPLASISGPRCRPPASDLRPLASIFSPSVRRAGATPRRIPRTEIVQQPDRVCARNRLVTV